VALLEKQKLGGVCLNEGCIPTKTLLNSAKHYEQALHGAAYGVTCAEVKLDQAAVIRRKNKVVRTLVAGVKSKLKAAKVTVLAEEARILGRQAEGFVVSGGEHRYAAPKLVIATGSSPVIPPIEGVREQLGSFVLTSREILDLETLPRRLTVIGGGVIGLEMAAYFAMAGTEVTVVEMQDHIGGMLDRELSQMLQKELGKKGITFLTGCRCQRVDAGMVLAVSKEGTEYQIPADRVLLSIGRRPNVQGLGLETVGVDYQPSGIPVDLTGQTNVAGIYAVGDVNGHHMLAHTAYREAEVAVNHILGNDDFSDIQLGI
jgi:dihydrolipoamide dehydrogenase